MGHSLESVIAYNVLGESNAGVLRYVTVGSPLGVKAIKRRLKAPLSMPGDTKSWYNAMDEGDVVALYPLDEQNFHINPAIVNFTDVDNGSDNQHGIEGYLSDAWVAQAIHGALTLP